MKRTSFLFLIAYVASLPFLLNNYLQPLLPQPWGGKIQLSEILYLLVIIAFPAALLRLKKSTIPVIVCLIGYIAAMGVSTVFSSDIKKSLVEYLGIIYLGSLLIVFPDLIDSPKRFDRAVYALVFSAGIVALIGSAGYVLARFFGVSNPFVLYYSIFMDGTWRLVSTLVLPNMAYGFLHSAFFIGLGVLFQRENGRLKKNILLLSVLCVILLAMLLTFSRGFYAFLFSIFIYGILSRRQGCWVSAVNKTLIVLAGCGAIALFLFSQLFVSLATDVTVSAQAGYSRDKMVDFSKQGSGVLFKEDDIFPDKRPYNELSVKVTFLPGFYWFMKKGAFMLLSKHPVCGVGPGCFNRQFSELRARLKPEVFGFLSPLKINDPHSTYLGSLAESGIIGFGTLALFLVMFFKRAYRYSATIPDFFKKHFIISTLAGIAGLLILGIDVDVLNFRWLWVAMALCLVPQSLSDQRE